MTEVTRDLLVRLRVLLSLHDARVDTADAWNLSMEEARSAIARAEAALADAKNDSYRLDAIEAVAKASGTGVSFDWCRHVEDGIVVEHGYRMMWKHAIGPREKSVRHAIDAAMEVFKP